MASTDLPAAAATAGQIPPVPAMIETAPQPAPAEGPAPVVAEAKVGAQPNSVPEQPEPQNALTQKFTEKEWAALRDFRATLPQLLKDSYADEPSKVPTSVKLWGVELNLDGVKTAKESVVLMKFLRARNLSVQEAGRMIVNTIRWREEFKVDEALQEQFPEEVFGSLGRIYGKDKGGRPVIYNMYGGNQDLKEIFRDTDRFMRWRVALMERSVLLLDFETIDQTVQIHDYLGVGMGSRTPESKRAVAEATNVFQSHYPELLYKKFFVNVPTIMSWLFWAFKAFLPAATIAKMSVVGTGSHAIGKELLPVIDKSELPERYGGEAKDF
ncbi:CRAL/TRIO domain-containing protein [Sistotremastrum niveocremeum HHB9708]|uniref:Phosphatidylinositol transfer protein SFH5 n=1 Tax=Sistotremastrum niveocremeum HHB9708 TaxID=1314777 RepID=A0A164VZS6_9AGAM|nr:CRAL/TRIO domain-containing protein [Sistotremastrum niveocremeum HHB9708]